MRVLALISCLLAGPLQAGELECRRSPDVPYGMGFLDPEIQARFGIAGTIDPFPDETTDWHGSWRISPSDAAAAALGVMEFEEEFGALWLRWDADLADPCSPIILVPVRLHGARLVADPDTLVRAKELGLYPAPSAPRESLPSAALNALRGLTLSRAGEDCQFTWPASAGAQALLFRCTPIPGD